SEHRLTADLARQKPTRRMHASESRITEQLLDSGGGEDAEPAVQVETAIDDAKGRLDGVALRGHDLHGPERPVVPAGRPVVSEAVEVWPDSLQIEYALGDRLLVTAMIRHRRTREGDRFLALDALHRDVECATREAVVDVGKPRQRPGEDAEDEEVG